MNRPRQDEALEAALLLGGILACILVGVIISKVRIWVAGL